MKQDEQLTELIKEYYNDIYRFCYSRLGCNVQSAEDCTQEVFLILVQKYASLTSTEGIRTWLLRTSERVVCNYLRKEKKHSHVQLEDVALSDDGGIVSLPLETPLDRLRKYLTDEELRLLTDYYSAEYGNRKALAERYGMSIMDLYHKIESIKKQILDNHNEK